MISWKERETLLRDIQFASIISKMLEERIRDERDSATVPRENYLKGVGP